MHSTFWSRYGAAALVALMLCSSIATAGASNNTIAVISGHNQDTSDDGLSIYVKFSNTVFLLCSSGTVGSLLHDLDAIHLDPAPIEAVVLFDGQSDDIQSLTGLLRATATPPKIYVSAAAARELSGHEIQAELVAVTKPTSVAPGAWLLGPMQFADEGNTVFEQMLVFDQPEGLIVVVGCDNPGIIPVVDKVRELFGFRKIKIVAGGFHLQGSSKSEIREISLRLQQKGVESLALSGCTGKAALKIFRLEWGDRVVSFDRGDSIDF